MTNVSPEHLEYLKKRRRRAWMVKAGQWLILFVFFGIWELAAAAQLIDPFIFSQPSRMWKAMIAMAMDGSLFTHISVTLGEAILGFVLSAILGTLAAVLLWWNPFLRKTLNPYLVVLNSLPKTALAPIIIVWIGNNVRAVIVTAILTSIVVTILTALTGFIEVSEDKIKLVETFGGSKRQVLTKVVLPASAPALVNAMEINIGLSFVGVIVGELLTAKAGLGYLIVYGSQIFKMDWVMLSVILLSLLAALLYQVIVALEKRWIQK
ncbi:MAG: ABC transporter permease [Clostridiales bacterium]|jgi:NitT/TauT family transport system permease protein|nr:ABC transporter permease [Clostridiales bacterium]